MRCRGFLFLLFFILLVHTYSVQASSYTENIRETNTAAGEEFSMEEDILEEIDFMEIQEMVDEMLGDNSFSFLEAVKKLMAGEAAFSREAAQELLRGLLFSKWQQEKDIFLRIFLLVLVASVFSNFAEVFDNGQIGEISFYVTYLLLFILLMEAFSGLSYSLETSLTCFTGFMKVLSPAYFLAVAASTGASTAAVFYQGVLVVVWLVQWALLTVLLPAVNLYVLLKLVNHLSKEETLGKLSELLETAISWGMKTMLGFVVGLQVVKGMVAPVIDSLKRTALGKTASAIPGVGNAVNLVTEIIVTSAVLVRNSLGVAFLIVFILAGAGPVIHYVLVSFFYKFLAAITQPISDKRMVGCLSTMGEGCSMLLRIIFTAEILCMLTFMILAVSFGGTA